VLAPEEIVVSEPVCSSFLTRFVSSFNPALADIRMLGTERLDKDKLRRVRRQRKVSVDLRRCYSQMVNHMLGIAAFPVMTEVVLNSIGGPALLTPRRPPDALGTLFAFSKRQNQSKPVKISKSVCLVGGVLS
jgi:hypothetical protein